MELLHLTSHGMILQVPLQVEGMKYPSWISGEGEDRESGWTAGGHGAFFIDSSG